MRNISNETFRHNATALLVALSAVSLLAGCGGGDAKEEKSAASAPRQETATGPVRIDSSGWTAFLDVAERIHAGEKFDNRQLAAVGEAPAYRTWSDCLVANRPDPARIGRWLEGAFWEELGREGTQKPSGDRAAMAASFRYSYDARDRIGPLIAEWSSPEFDSRFLTLVRRWITPERVPDPLTIRFLPALPELRYCSGELVVDTGVLAAGSNRQLETQLAAMLYRNLETIPVPDRNVPGGEVDVADGFRLLLNEGVATWIERSPYTFFRPDHFSLRRVSLVPETFFQNGIRTTQYMNEFLPKMFADPAEMARLGPRFRVEAGAGGSLAQAGYAMAATIVHRLGEDRLVAVKDSVPEFLVAYQEAALANPAPRPQPGDDGSELPETMPPLDPETYEQALELLRRVYPQ